MAEELAEESAQERPELPRANLPERFGSYKIVQLWVGDEPYLRFDESGSTHAIILGNFQLEFGYHEIEYEAKNMPARETDDYRVSGMGWAQIQLNEGDDVDNEAYFYHDSRIYLIGVDWDHLDAFKTRVTGWDFKHG